MVNEEMPAADGYFEFFVNRDADGIVGQLSDNVEEETGGHDAGASLLDLGIDGDGNARFEIITGKRQLYAGPDINSLERRNGALLRDGTEATETALTSAFFSQVNFMELPPFLLSRERKDIF